MSCSFSKRSGSISSTGNKVTFFFCESENVSVIQVQILLINRVMILLKVIMKVSNFLLQFN